MKNKHDDISCSVDDDGDIKAKRIDSLKDGAEIKTVTIGLPDGVVGSLAIKRSDAFELPRLDHKFFAGQSTLKEKGKPPMKLLFDAHNLGEDSLAGKAAEIGKQDLLKCWSKLGPSF